MAKFPGDWGVAIEGGNGVNVLARDNGGAAIDFDQHVDESERGFSQVIENGATTIITYPTLPALRVAVQGMATL